MKEFIQLRVSLEKSNPLIWRRIIVHKATSFFELHHIIQITMGWQNYHCYEFNLQGYRIGEVYENDGSKGFGSGEVMESKTITLMDIITNKGDIIKYEYDFGDGWQHTIEVEEFMDVDQTVIYPICINGQMNCPPEDCGGISGFYDYLEILKNKKHPEHKEMKRWFPRGYDAQKFDSIKATQALLKLDKYIDKWLKSE